MSSHVKHLLLLVLGIVLILAGLVTIFLDFLALLDPVGAKAADDGDPFGIPPTRFSILLQIIVAAAVSLVGVWLVVRSIRWHSRLQRHSFRPGHREGEGPIQRA
jgi:hypothetical protein